MTLADPRQGFLLFLIEYHWCRSFRHGLFSSLFPPILSWGVFSLNVLVGILPHSLKREQMDSKQTLEIRALFWHLFVCRQSGKCNWTVDIPIIRFIWERLRH